MNSSKNKLRTRLVVPREQIKREWHLVDAKDKILGRVAVDISNYLQGRHKTSWSAMQDQGDHVVVLNAEAARLSGNKMEVKRYYRHSRHLGNLKEVSYARLTEKRPTEGLRKAVYGMLPKKKFRKDMLRRLHLIEGDKNPYSAHFIDKQ